jgi:hypothetical protein
MFLLPSDVNPSCVFQTVQQRINALYKFGVGGGQLTSGRNLLLVQAEESATEEDQHEQRGALSEDTDRKVGEFVSD